MPFSGTYTLNPKPSSLILNSDDEFSGGTSSDGEKGGFEDGFEAGQDAEQYLYQTEADAGRPNMVSESPRLLKLTEAPLLL